MDEVRNPEQEQVVQRMTEKVSQHPKKAKTVEVNGRQIEVAYRTLKKRKGA